jgi:uncharacterized membrane protein
MLTPLESGIFDTIAGLPVHPLVVHFAVVLLPLAALALVVLVFVPKWADRFGLLTLITLVVGTGAAFVAKESGEALATHVGTPDAHASWGDLLPLLAVGLVLLAGVWYYLHRRAGGAGAPRSMAVLVTGLIASVLAVIVTGVTVLVGHSGAESAWAGVVAGANDQPTPAASTAASSPASGKPASTASSAATNYTLAEVAKHADQSSCWSVVNGNVYDLTKWIGGHPGGPKRILDMCGQDGTAAFDGQHGNQKRPEAILKGYLLGPLH